jgi:hypothetical protein
MEEGRGHGEGKGNNGIKVENRVSMELVEKHYTFMYKK